MDASVSPKPDADFQKVIGFVLKMDNSSYPKSANQRNTIIRYTKLPDFDFEASASWSTQSYNLQPRLRRIITLDDDDVKSNRSLRSNVAVPPKIKPSNNTKRKIVTITEDEQDLHPRISKSQATTPVKTSNRSVLADIKAKPSLNKTTTRLMSPTKYGKDMKNCAKKNSAFIKKDVNLTRNNKGRNNNVINETLKSTKNLKEREPLRQNRNGTPTCKISLCKNYGSSTENDKELSRIKNMLYDDMVPQKKPLERAKINKNPPSTNKCKGTTLKDIQSKIKPLTVIRVPVDVKKPKGNVGTHINMSAIETYYKSELHNNSDKIIKNGKNVMIGTDPLPQTLDQITQIDESEVNGMNTCETSIQTDFRKEVFDSLQIPNVSLTLDKHKSKDESDCFHSSSLPNLIMPSFKIAPQKEEVNCSDISFCQSASYIYSRATLTYTTRQKINFHVVGNENDTTPGFRVFPDDHVNGSLQPPSPLHYPINVVSVFKNELKNKNINENTSSDDSQKKKNCSRDEYINCLNELSSLNCSYVVNKLMKPSDIISTIRINNGILQTDYICEQFQRELNFIDSFFESLQYLENCSLSDKCFSDNKVENLVTNSVLFDSTFDVKNLEYDSFLSKLENGTNIDDTETLASKSLCLLNLLIRDEQRRAKNLLFVLKMREDALKDFTKSQILWLEKKKKHENTDISTLKKKQRGALLKLQHECGEMQRMRKALLTLSEKRKLALLKTKKNIELKINNNLDVDQIILGKKKMKRSVSNDRNTTPLKCFDLSSSGCEESTTSRPNSDVTLLTSEVLVPAIQSAEKCIQTNDFSNSATSNSSPQHGPELAENFVAVDGGYLNILFHNLALPQIFSGGKQYEVNEEALKNIVNSSNNHNDSLNGSKVGEKIIDQIRNKELDSSSTASTARSLVDEFDQYYKNLVEDDKLLPEAQEQDSFSSQVYEVKDSFVQPIDIKDIRVEERCSSTMTGSSDNTMQYNDSNVSSLDRECVCEVSMESECSLDKELVNSSQVTTGPLPVPVGAALVETQAPDLPPSTWPLPKSPTTSPSETDSSTGAGCLSVSSIATLATPHSEAEELRRQQLAIEREIKALEQQQCRMLVVREIPDKPPPPYTPPTEVRTQKPPRLFAPNDNTTQKIEKYITETIDFTDELTDAFDTFLRDYCDESLESHKLEQSDKPWDACNLLPQKPQVETQKLVHKTSTDLEEVLTGVAPAVVSGVSSRRSDHIDDILFAEWRRCEPEWTALHTDEVTVKNQLFESIFQKILTETIDEYKKNLHCPEDSVVPP